MKDGNTSLFRFAELIAKPWPNRKGMTRDVAGEKSSSESLRWLISIAELVEDAPFSHYEGCDRIFTLVGDSPVDLHVGTAAPVRCNSLVPFCFPGDQRTRCALLGEATRAFNVFVARAEMKGTVSSLVIASAHEITLPRPPFAVHCVSGAVKIHGEVLRTGDTLVGDLHNCKLVGGDIQTKLLVVDLQAKSGNAPAIQ